MAYYRPSKYGDCKVLAPNLRYSDKREVWASHGLRPLKALQFSFLLSQECNTIISNKEDIIGMFGVNNMGNIGVPWMLASNGLYEPSTVRKFVKVSREWVSKTQNRYPILVNYVAKENQKTIKWLRFLGFTFTNLIENYGVNPQPFYEFIRIRS
tara:strand:- start:10006 stop:10467 length:462 start_codon:yes stop_codon:yes gene_type:complete